MISLAQDSGSSRANSSIKVHLGNYPSFMIRLAQDSRPSRANISIKVHLGN